MTAEKFKRKLTAILGADVKGDSRLLGGDEEWTLRTLTAYKGVRGGFIQQYRGRIVGGAGEEMGVRYVLEGSVRLGLAHAYIRLGREKEAQAEAAEVLRIHPKFSLEHKTLPLKEQSAANDYITGLRQAGSEIDIPMCISPNI